jgi:hypothetical protein
MQLNHISQWIQVKKNGTETELHFINGKKAHFVLGNGRD